MSSLLEFASKKSGAEVRSRCSVCRIPGAVLDEIHESRRLGVIFRHISEWLADEHDIHIPFTTIRQHFTSKHHLR